ncbi:hypothetical protein HL273_08705 [Yersinia enterocolitica]|uniref:hypothetical protein n=1 Tax=Yersinia TaxID=629 RepID=UPI0005E55692|nr:MULTISPECIES: hypothetical protein [Yersinia]MBX9485841.1 hypothetical protein [Yersinia enterocolitica]NQS96698.1 hypothetical protein [Yersinia enterocolitica]NQT43375.1 hypothetical protein [Yersinia enterocolitica]NQT98825.1 hypothetical protein [Yersinia enterocolitica]CNK29358.1 Uncharacterised protein [Yersinia aldovae]
MKIKLSKPYIFEKREPVQEIELNLEHLTGNDFIAAIEMLQAEGYVSVSPNLDMKVQANIVAAALGEPIEYVCGLPMPDFAKVCQRVQTFLLK